MAEGSAKPKHQKKQWFAGVNKDGAGGGRGRGRGGRGGGGGGDRGGGGGRGGRGGRGGGRGGYHGGGGGGEEPSGDKQHHLGRYRDKHLPEMLAKRGIVATAVNNKEKSAERELMEYLEVIADELYPETIEKEAKEDDDIDLEEMLKRELEGMSAKAKKSNRFIFYVIVLEPLDPVRLVHRILEKTEETAKCPFRFLRRIVPVTATTNATLPALKTMSAPVVKAGFETPDNRSLTYGIMPNTRSSQKLERFEMIKAVADIVTDLDVKHTVDLKNQERTILIELHKNVVGISVVQDYYRFTKYNPIALAEQTASKRDAANRIEAATDRPDTSETAPKVGSDSAPSVQPAAGERGAEGAGPDGVKSPSKRKAEDLS